MMGEELRHWFGNLYKNSKGEIVTGPYVWFDRKGMNLSWKVKSLLDDSEYLLQAIKEERDTITLTQAKSYISQLTQARGWLFSCIQELEPGGIQ